jgi:hypothetical protein
MMSFQSGVRIREMGEPFVVNYYGQRLLVSNGEAFDGFAELVQAMVQGTASYDGTLRDARSLRVALGQLMLNDPEYRRRFHDRWIVPARTLADMEAQHGRDMVPFFERFPKLAIVAEAAAGEGTDPSEAAGREVGADRVRVSCSRCGEELLPTMTQTEQNIDLKVVPFCKCMADWDGTLKDLLKTSIVPSLRALDGGGQGDRRAKGELRLVLQADESDDDA